MKEYYVSGRTTNANKNQSEIRESNPLLSKIMWKNNLLTYKTKVYGGNARWL